MKKIMLIGKVSCGKTTLCQYLTNQAIKYKKTQALKLFFLVIHLCSLHPPAFLCSGGCPLSFSDFLFLIFSHTLWSDPPYFPGFLPFHTVPDSGQKEQGSSPVWV